MKRKVRALDAMKADLKVRYKKGKEANQCRADLDKIREQRQHVSADRNAYEQQRLRIKSMINYESPQKAADCNDSLSDDSDEPDNSSNKHSGEESAYEESA